MKIFLTILISAKDGLRADLGQLIDLPHIVGLRATFMHGVRSLSFEVSFVHFLGNFIQLDVRENFPAYFFIKIFISITIIEMVLWCLVKCNH